MEVLILSKTVLGEKNVCVGGVVLSTKQYVRLLNPPHYYPFADCPYQVGLVWDMNLEPAKELVEPHNEDVLVHSKRLIGRIDDIPGYITSHDLPIWEGAPEVLFDGTLTWSWEHGFLIEGSEKYPSHSVGFWRPDYDLVLTGLYYTYRPELFSTPRKLKYKGVAAPIKVIPAQTLVRVSLAKWHPKDLKDSEEERKCHLQLSGWY